MQLPANGETLSTTEKFDEEGRLREKWEDVGDNHLGTKYDEKGREIENIEWESTTNGSTTREKPEQGANGTRTGFTHEKRDHDGN